MSSKSLLFLLPAFMLVSFFIKAQSNPIGWASLNGGTTGGQGGEVVTAVDRNSFVDYCASDDPLIIRVSDTLDLNLYERVLVTSNKTILGASNNAMLRYGGLVIRGKNVIVRNLIIRDSYDGDWDGKTNSTDAITVENSNVWIDHCWLSTSADGLLDVRSNSNDEIGDFVTVSYTRFTDHNKVSLIGSSDDAIRDRNHLKVTFHHCWFDGTIDKGLHQRLPRIRYGDVHMFNNYFEDIDDYCILARIESDVVVENNYFRNSPNPHGIEDVGLGIEDPDLVAKGNFYEFSEGSKLESGVAFVPGEFYEYTLDNVTSIPSLVMNEAGPFNVSGNKDPVALEDQVTLDVNKNSIEVDVLLNDYDEDNGELRLGGISNNPKGIILIRNDRMRYIRNGIPTAPDTILYELIDTDGGMTLGTLVVNFEELLMSSSKEYQNQSIIAITPNPVENKLFLKIEDEKSKLVSNDVSIVTSGGKVYAQKLIRSHDNLYYTDLEQLQSGVYFITVKTNNGKLTIKFVKE